MRAIVCFLALAASASSSMPQEMLAAHNAVRRHPGLPPLRWSTKLAARAQEWADHLAARNEFRHRPSNSYGENLFEATNWKASPTEVVNEWASERRDYDYPSNACRRVCGHYTQIVWRNTAEVGCGVAKRGRREVWVCNYNPPGNYVGQRPY